LWQFASAMGKNKAPKALIAMTVDPVKRMLSFSGVSFFV
jgi:hypothetical protein